MNFNLPITRSESLPFDNDGCNRWLALSSEIEVPRDVRNSKSRTNSGENGLNIRTNASPE